MSFEGEVMGTTYKVILYGKEIQTSRETVRKHRNDFENKKFRIKDWCCQFCIRIRNQDRGLGIENWGRKIFKFFIPKYEMSLF